MKKKLTMAWVIVVLFSCVCAFIAAYAMNGPPPVDMKEMDVGFVVCVLAVLCLVILPVWAISDMYR